MEYVKALQLWGAQKLLPYAIVEGEIDPESVSVTTDFDEGFACCGGRDPDCYCSYAQSPSADVVISSPQAKFNCTIDLEDFDFATVLGEIVAAGNGKLES